MNAIDRLGELVDAEWKRWDDDYGPEEGVPAPRDLSAAIASVDALYQAAKALDPFPFATAYDKERDAVDALAAAVRRVEGE